MDSSRSGTPCRGRAPLSLGPMTLRAGAVPLAAAAALLASLGSASDVPASSSRAQPRAPSLEPAKSVYSPEHFSFITHTTLLFRGQTLGKYKIIAPLGSGGFGTVYLAQDTWIDKKVAIKVPHRQGLDFGELLREPRLLASVSHPNIVADHHRGEAGQRLLHRDGVRARARRSRTSSPRRARSIVNRALDFTCQICNAVDHAHRQGVIHRDLRPANVLVTENDMLKVADFGTSRFLEIAAHGTTVIGSPPYMAPEQFHGKAVFASDIYSLGVTMYQMLTGIAAVRHAGAGRSRSADVAASWSSPPRLKNPAIPKAISDIVMRAMAPDVTDALSAGRRAARRRARRRATPATPRAGRSRRRRAAAGAPATTRRASRRGCGRAKRRPAGSAGSAASRCTRAPIAARSAAKRSKSGPVANRRPSPAAIGPLMLASVCYVRRPQGALMAFPGTGKIWMNGTLVDWADAKIHVASHVIHYGSGVFEGARCYDTPRGSACFRLDAHMRRLLRLRARSTGWSRRSIRRR